MEAPREPKSSRRIKAEYGELNFLPQKGIQAGPKDANNIYEWKIDVQGPLGTAYEGADIPGIMTFPTNYPLLPPKVKLLGHIFHPNVAADGTVEIPILHTIDESPSLYVSSQERWSPTQRVEKVLIAVREMFVHPCEENIANTQAGNLLKADKNKFEETVKQSIRMTPAL
ncbi:hypothetical protein FBU30_004066 [Linnemannia zychae]|nr:hypothetical protein FBU30_004066 [Linnemannia zychae]